MKRTLLIIGGSGFFGKSIIDFLEKKSGIEKKINKIIIITKSSNVFLSKKFKQKFQVNHLKQDISKIKNLPFAHIIIYHVFLHTEITIKYCLFGLVLNYL